MSSERLKAEMGKDFEWVPAWDRIFDDHEKDWVGLREQQKDCYEALMVSFARQLGLRPTPPGA